MDPTKWGNTPLGVPIIRKGISICTDASSVISMQLLENAARGFCICMTYTIANTIM